MQPNFGNFFRYIYGFAILSAILTTAISAGYSLLKNISKTKKQYVVFSIFICIISLFFSTLGFSNLLNILYPILGYLGLFQICTIFFKFFID